MMNHFSLSQKFAAAGLAVVLPLAAFSGYFYATHEAPSEPEIANIYEWNNANDVRLTVPSLNSDVSHFCDKNNISSVALLVVDIQGYFCDTSQGGGSVETELVAERAKSIVPEFRKASIPVYMIYYKLGGNDPDLYKVTAASTDIMIGKDNDSAFKGSDIAGELRKRGHSILLVCGVNRDFCVHDTVINGIKQDYKVYVLSDVTGSSHTGGIESGLQELQDGGATITTSAEILRVINDVNASLKSPPALKIPALPQP